MKIVHENSPHYNEWLKRRNLAIQKKKQRRKHNHYSERLSYVASKKNERISKTYGKKSKFEPETSLKTPEVFSFFANCIETAEFFAQVIGIIENKKTIRQIFFDMRHIVVIEIDALIYLISLIYNIKSSQTDHHNFKGNFPINDNARQLMMDSGFLNYFKTNAQKVSPKNDCFTIKVGRIYKQNEIAELCDYICNLFETSITCTQHLYSVLSELMMNTREHAYDTEVGPLINSWYLFAQAAGDTIKITFHDNGFGIPDTVSKRAIEQISVIAGKILSIDTDSKYLLSAFSGEFRSKTLQSNRGRGLPDVYDHFRKGHINRLSVISGKAYCQFDKENIEESSLIDLENSISGTLFYFEFSKEQCGGIYV